MREWLCTSIILTAIIEISYVLYKVTSGLITVPKTFESYLYRHEIYHNDTMYKNE